MAGGDILGQTTSQVCAEMCAFNESMSNCVAVEYYYYTDHCVVHTDETDLEFMIPHPGADVYVMIRCNETGTAPSTCYVRLPSNSLRATTRECVHLVTRVVTLPVTLQRWRSHHSIRHSRKPHAARKLHGSMFYRTGVIADRSFT